MGLTTGETGNSRMKAQREARAWLASPEAAAFALEAGLPERLVRPTLARYTEAA